MPPKKKNHLEKSGLSGKIMKWGGLATAIAAILTLLWTVLPGWKPTPPSNVLKVEFTGGLSPQKQSLKDYLATLGIDESKALGSSQGSVGSAGTSKPGGRPFSPKATAGQIKGLERSFSQAEINKLGTTFRVPMRFTGTAGKRYYLQWALVDGSNTQVYSSKADFSHEIKIQYQGGDDTFSEIWVPTEGHSGVFFVRVEIFDEEKNPVALKESEKIQLP